MDAIPSIIFKMTISVYSVFMSYNFIQKYYIFLNKIITHRFKLFCYGIPVILLHSLENVIYIVYFLMSFLKIAL